MSLWQYFAESYDENTDALKIDYPLSATSISNNTEWIAVIVVDGNGNFSRAYKIEKAPKGEKAQSFNLPVTEKSAGRTSGAEPHPVFDQYDYLKGTGKKFDLYLNQLKVFATSSFATPQIEAIYAYILKKTVENDLKKLVPTAKTNILFEVEIEDNPFSKIWKNASFFDAWHNYYMTLKTRRGLDVVTGCEGEPLAESHPKKISNASANAKLVSDNDTSNFTFRGRFECSKQAVSIGYETSQKAHQFLRYLVNDRGIVCGEQVILSLTVGSVKNSLPIPLDDTKSILDFLDGNAAQTDSDKCIALRAGTGFDYANALKIALSGFRCGVALEQHAKTVVLALDAAIPGRLAVTFCRELSRKEYLEKIAEWHEDCKWNQRFWSEEIQRFVSYIGTPSVDRIIEAVFGKSRGLKDDGYIKIKKTARERLLRCIFDGAFLPFDYVASVVRRASNPLAVTKGDKFDRNGFYQLVSTACALVRKDFKQRKEEDYALSLEPTRTDRDYLYGRLLGAADKLEEYALYKNEKDRIVTAAIRHMQAFSQRPFRTWQTIHGCLNPYIQTVKGSFAFNEIQSVMQLFKFGDYEKDTPLDGSYLIGYYHERTHIDNLGTQAKISKQSNSDNQTEKSHE